MNYKNSVVCGKPLVTLGISTYNHEEYVRECILSAFAQTYSPLEIVISDDCSTDKTFTLIKEIVAEYKGPHKVVLNRNENNLGPCGNLNKRILELSKGEFCIACAGDDISLPERVQVLVDTWQSSGHKYKAIFSNAIHIDETGREFGAYFYEPPSYKGTIEQFVRDNLPWYKTIFTPSVWMLGATAGYEKCVFDYFGPIDERAKQEDGVISFRALLMGELLYIDQCLVKYRRHGRALSNNRSYSSRIYLLKNEYYYFASQYKDALSIGASSAVLRKILYFKRVSYIKRIVFSIPVFNKFVLILLLKISRMIKEK